VIWHRISDRNPCRYRFDCEVTHAKKYRGQNRDSAASGNESKKGWPARPGKTLWAWNAAQGRQGWSLSKAGNAREKTKALKRAIWPPARVFKEGQFFAPWLKISPPEILETSKLQLIEFSVFDSVGGRSQYLKVWPVAAHGPLLGFMQIESSARHSMIDCEFWAVIWPIPAAAFELTLKASRKLLPRHS
jgi:hypothetical protein